MTEGMLLLIIFVTSFAAVALTVHALQQSFGHKLRSGRNIRSAAETGLMPGTEAVAAADRVAETDLLQRQPGIDRRGGAGRLCLALQGQHPVLGVFPGHRSHPCLLGRSQF